MDLLTDASGEVVQQMSFDAWGQRRNALDWSSLTLTELASFDHSLITRGYTGHEMLDEVGLIHMNGRIYDPRLGRFLQADPFVDGEYNTQGYSRYSYGKNNPLSGVDPSGFEFFSEVFDDILGITESPVLNAALQMLACSYGGPWGCALYATASARGHGASWDQAIQAGVTAWVSAAAFSEIGGMDFGSYDAYIRPLAHGAVGGFTSVLQGGKFGHGFVSAGIGAAVGSIKGLQLQPGQSLKNFGRAAIRITVAGTVSRATGGKFANGAATAAFAVAMQAAASGSRNRPGFTEGGVEVDYSQLEAEADYQLVDDHLASLVGDVSVDQASLAIAGTELGFHYTRAQLAAATITSRDVVNGAMRHHFIRSQHEVVTYAKWVTGVTGVAGGASYGLRAMSAWPPARKLMAAESLRRAISWGAEEVLGAELPSASGYPKPRIPSVPPRPTQEYSQPIH